MKCYSRTHGQARRRQGPPSYRALSVEYAPWPHTQRHPGSPVAPRAPTHSTTESMPTNGANRQRDFTARTLVPCTRSRRVVDGPREHTTAPLHPPARSQGLRPAISTIPALSSGPLCARLPPQYPPHAGASRTPHGTDPTRHSAAPTALHTSRTQGHPAHAHVTHLAASRDGCLSLLTSRGGHAHERLYPVQPAGRPSTSCTSATTHSACTRERRGPSRRAHSHGVCPVHERKQACTPMAE